MRYWLCFYLLGSIVSSAYCQDKTAVKKTVQAMFDAMRASDSAALAKVFHPDITFKTVVRDKNGLTRLISGDVQAFLQAVGTPHAEVWDERILSWEIRLDGDLATVWTKYVFYLGSKRSHQGYNAFQLVRQGDQWLIFHVADTRQ